MASAIVASGSRESVADVAHLEALRHLIHEHLDWLDQTARDVGRVYPDSLRASTDYLRYAVDALTEAQS